MSEAWRTPVGWTGTREEIAAMYGGSTNGGMETPAKSPNVLLFSDPEVGRQNGYEFDGWVDDTFSLFTYTGMDRRGPQRMHKGNLYTRDHKLLGRSLRLFGVAGKVPNSNAKLRIYLGEFEIDDDRQYSVEDAPGSDKVMRTVFVFNLRPVADVLRRVEDIRTIGAKNPTPEGSATEVALESNNVTEFDRAGTDAGTSTRREQELTTAFEALLKSRGSELNRFKVYPKGSTTPLFTDIHDKTNGILYEAKADATRNSVRAGLGQLLDYRRYVDGRPCRLLLPAAPNEDLLELVAEHGIAVVWRVGKSAAFRIYETGETRAF